MENNKNLNSDENKELNDEDWMDALGLGDLGNVIHRKTEVENLIEEINNMDQSELEKEFEVIVKLPMRQLKTLEAFASIENDLYNFQTDFTWFLKDILKDGINKKVKDDIAYLDEIEELAERKKTVTTFEEYKEIHNRQRALGKIYYLIQCEVKYRSLLRNLWLEKEEV